MMNSNRWAFCMLCGVALFACAQETTKPIELPKDFKGKEGQALLRPFLRHSNPKVRRLAIDQLAKIPDPAVDELLLKYYRELPEPEISSHQRNEPEKMVLIKHLIRRETGNGKDLLLQFLDKEVELARKTKQHAPFFPYGTTDTILELIRDGYLDDQSVRQHVDTFVNDKSLPFQMRESLAALTVAFQMQEDNKTIEKKIQLAVDKMTPMPVAPIPWNVFRDQDKRIQYSSTEGYKRKVQSIGEWRRSRQGIYEMGLERAILGLGPNVVPVLVEEVRRANISSDKADTLMILAARAFVNQLKNKGKLSEEEIALLDVIKAYEKKMEDLGAHDRKSRLAGLLNTLTLRLIP